MAGYDHSAGMSNNATAAYSVGVKPISQISRADLDEAGLNTLPVDFARWLARKGHWPAAEWHHSGGSWFNKVNFYDPAHLCELIDEGDLDLVALRSEWKRPAETNSARVRGRYAEWGGSRRRPTLLGHVEFTGTLAAGWIHLDTGGRKKASGNHITWHPID